MFKYFLTKYFIAFFCLVFVIVLHFYSRTTAGRDHYNNIIQSAKDMIGNTQTGDSKKIPTVKDHPAIEYQKWTVNFNILQYSSYIVINHTNVSRIETIFEFGFIDNEGFVNDSYTYKKINCALKNRFTGEINFYNATSVFRLYTRPMTALTYRIPWKAVCEIAKLNDTENWDVAVLDTEDQYEKKLTLDIRTEQMNGLIQFQRTKIIDARIPKTKAIGHCLHAIRYLDAEKTERLIRWLKFQKLFGYKEVKIYFFDDASIVTDKLYEYFDREFVKVTQHQLEYEDVCDWHIRRYVENPYDFTSMFLYNYCRAIWTRTFIFTDNHNDETNFIHGRSMTNDCYLQFKYKYEFTTNYDFDELLLPRKYRPFDVVNAEEYFKCDSNDFKKYRYNAYEYAVEMFNKYGKHKTSSIEFDCLPYLSNDANMTSFIGRLEAVGANKVNLIAQNQGVSVALEKIIFPAKYPSYMFYFVNVTDYDYVAHLIKTYKIYIECMKNKTIITDFNNAIASAYNLPYFPMKSIFNTDLTEYTTFHYGAPAPNSAVIRVPVEEAFVSHFRDKTDRYYHKQNMTIREFAIDVEYYKFFLNNY